MRLPPALDDPRQPGVGQPSHDSATGDAATGLAVAGAHGDGQESGLRPPVPLRRVTSADLLVRLDDGDDHDLEDDDADQFSSDVRLRPIGFVELCRR